MRFKITLNMPSRRGNLVHQILCEHASDSIHEFLREWRDEDYIVVTELYNQDDGTLVLHEDIGLTFSLGAKVSLMTERTASY